MLQTFHASHKISLISSFLKWLMYPNILHFRLHSAMLRQSHQEKIKREISTGMIPCRYVVTIVLILQNKHSYQYKLGYNHLFSCEAEGAGNDSSLEPVYHAKEQNTIPHNYMVRTLSILFTFQVITFKKNINS
jgi:hypothetical protein